MDATLMIRPPPWRRITRATACAQRKTPVRFTAITRFHSSGVMASLDFSTLMPALLMRTSIRPPPEASAASSLSASRKRAPRDLPGHALRARAVKVTGHHLGARFREAESDDAADASAGAGDQAAQAPNVETTR